MPGEAAPMLAMMGAPARASSRPRGVMSKGVISQGTRKQRIAPHSRRPRQHSAGPRGPTLRQQCAAGSAAPEKTTIVLDSPYDRHISHARDGAGSKVSPRRLTSLLPSRGVRQMGPSAILVSMYYISRTWSWVKVTIWLPSPPMGLTIHIGAQVHGEPRGIC